MERKCPDETLRMRRLNLNRCFLVHARRHLFRLARPQMSVRREPVCTIWYTNTFSITETWKVYKCISQCPTEIGFSHTHPGIRFMTYRVIELTNIYSHAFKWQWTKKRTVRPKLGCVQKCKMIANGFLPWIPVPNDERQQEHPGQNTCE